MCVIIVHQVYDESDFEGFEQEYLDSYQDVHKYRGLLGISHSTPVTAQHQNATFLHPSYRWNCFNIIVNSCYSSLKKFPRLYAINSIPMFLYSGAAVVVGSGSFSTGATCDPPVVASPPA